MISRIWHGYTTRENAEAYEELLRNEVFVEIESKNVAGFKSIQLLRRELETEVEFITMMLFDNLESVIQFAGEDYEKAFVPQKAREILLRFDATSAHYELRKEIKY